MLKFKEIEGAVMTIKEAGKVTGYSPATIHKAIKTRALPAVKPVGCRAYRITGKDLYDWLTGGVPYKALPKAERDTLVRRLNKGKGKKKGGKTAKESD